MNSVGITGRLWRALAIRLVLTVIAAPLRSVQSAMARSGVQSFHSPAAALVAAALARISSLARERPIQVTGFFQVFKKVTSLAGRRGAGAKVSPVK